MWGGGKLGRNKGQRHSKVKGAETGCSFNFSKSTGRFSEGKLIERLGSAFSPTVHSKFPRLGLELVWVLLKLVQTYVGLTKGAKPLVYPLKVGSHVRWPWSHERSKQIHFYSWKQGTRSLDAAANISVWSIHVY